MARGQPKVVERDEHRFAVAGEVAEPFQRRDLVPGVEARRGLIGEDQGRVLRQRAGDQDAGLFSARKLCRGALSESGKVHGGKRIGDGGLILRPGALAARQVRHTAQHHEGFDSDGPRDFPRLRQPRDLPRAVCRGQRSREFSPVEGKKPSAARISVVLPAPFGPIRPTTSPAPMASVALSTTGHSPRRTVIP
jgi:hypothetical protein